jgi:hypothetical protein
MASGTRANLDTSNLTISSLARIDYGDLFTIPATVTETPEIWMRRIFGNRPNFFQKIIWTGLLGFSLSPSQSPDTIAGWKISGRGGDWIRIENRSWFLAGNLICQTSKNSVSVITLLQYRHWFGRCWWPMCSIVHRMIMPWLLGAAVRRTKVD